MTIYPGGFQKISVDLLFPYRQFITENVENICSKVATTVWKRWRKETQYHRRKDWINYKIWHWTVWCRLVWVGIYYSLSTRGECDSEFLRFMGFQIKHKQCLPAVMCTALLCMVFAKKSVIAQVIPQRRGKQGRRTPQPLHQSTDLNSLSLLFFLIRCVSMYLAYTLNMARVWFDSKRLFLL